MTCKKLLVFLLSAAVTASALCSFSGGAFAAQAVSNPPYPQVEFQYTDTVTPGVIRYTSQNQNSDVFDARYWNNDASAAQHQCLAACLSMTLSYVGVDATPGYILAQNGGVAKPSSSWGGSTYSKPSFAAAWQNYYTGDGKYSPPIIHLNSYSSGGHYVLVIAKVSDNVYQVADPYETDLWKITVSGSTVSYNYYGASKTDTIDGAIQYYKENGGIPGAVTEPEPQPAVQTELKFVIGSTSFTNNGTEKLMDIAPYIKNGRTYLPARYVCEEMGADVEWDQATSTVTITRDGIVIALRINSTAATVNGQPETLATAPEIYGGRTCLPIRYVVQTLGGEVGWEQSTKTATITFTD